MSVEKTNLPDSRTEKMRRSIARTVPIARVLSITAGVLTVAILFGTEHLFACPACADNLAASQGETAKGFGASILGLLSLPFLLIGAIGFVVVRSDRKKKRFLKSGALLLLFGLFIGTVGCGGDSADKANGAAAAGRIPADMSKAVEVSGTIAFEGIAPALEAIDVSADKYCGVRHEGGVIYSGDILVKDGKLENVFVYVSKGLEKYSFDLPSTPAVLDQKGCRYEPHVLGLMTGQKLEIRNSDSTLHNIHAMTKENKAFNLGQTPGAVDTKTFENEEAMIPVVCDVHGWMKSWIAVLHHPAFGVSNAEGAYSFKAPPGEYTVTAWHERFGKQEMQVAVKEGEPVVLNFTFK